MVKEKNKWIAVTLSLVIVGAGYAYINKWWTFTGFIVLQVCAVIIGVPVFLIPLIAALFTYRDTLEYNKKLEEKNHGLH